MGSEVVIWKSCVLHTYIWFPPQFPRAWRGWALSWVHFLCQLSFTQLYFPSFYCGHLPFSLPCSDPALLPPFPTESTCWHGRWHTCWPEAWELGYGPLWGPGPLLHLAPCFGHMDYRGRQKSMPGVWEPPCSGVLGAGFQHWSGMNGESCTLLLC